MSEKKVKTRIIHKHDIEFNWLKSSFIPKQGEIIVYDIEVDSDGATLELPQGRTTPYTYERQKIGDGITLVNDLPFTTNMYIQSTAPTGNLPVGTIWIDTSVVSTVQAEEASF